MLKVFRIFITRRYIMKGQVKLVKVRMLLLVLLFSASFASGDQVWGVNYNLTEFQDKFQDFELWYGNSSNFDIFVNSTNIPQLKKELEDNKIIFTIKIDNVEELINKNNPLERRGILSWKAYYPLRVIYNYLDDLAKNYPQICTVSTIGLSVEKRPIQMIIISNKRRGNKKVFIDGGIHAREWISPASVTYFIEHLIKNFQTLTSLLKRIDWYIVPVLNPDGYEYTFTTKRLWRKNRAKYGNCFGVDLNRNFGQDWGRLGSSGDPCNQYYRGPKAFSEPETAAIATLLGGTDLRWSAFISVHSYGQHVVYPWGTRNVPPPDYQDLHAIANKAAREIFSGGGEHYSVGSAADLIYPASGISTDWARGVLGVKYAYTIELRDRGQYGYLLPAELIEITAQEAMIIIKNIAEAAAL